MPKIFSLIVGSLFIINGAIILYAQSITATKRRERLILGIGTLILGICFIAGYYLFAK